MHLRLASCIMGTDEATNTAGIGIKLTTVSGRLEVARKTSSPSRQ